MKAKEMYLKTHLSRGIFDDSDINLAETIGCIDRKSWKDYFIDENMIFSHRTNYYTRDTFDEGLHSHGYKELLIYVRGNVEYIDDNKLIKPEPYSVVWFDSEHMHTARLECASEYERYVMYFSPEFFDHDGAIIPMTDFMSNGSAFNTDSHTSYDMKSILQKLESVLSSNAGYRMLLAKALLVELFGIFNSAELLTVKSDHLSDKMSEIKNYIDKNYSNITGTEDIAQKFFYSREHLSRSFKNRFNVSISEYLARRRISASLELLNNMSVTDAAYAVGFRSLSSYIAFFKENTGMLPSEYKKRI